MIYEIMRLKLWNLYKMLIDKNIKPYCIKTDCILVKEPLCYIKKKN